MKLCGAPLRGMAWALVLAACVTLPNSLQASTLRPDPLIGEWLNSKGTVTVRIQRCGQTSCGFVVSATEKAKQRAREGGTPNLIGTRVLTNLQPAGDAGFKGQVFDPKRNINASATLRLIGPRTLLVTGCVLAGLICKKQRWTRVH